MVRVLYFAALRDLVGTSEEQVELPSSVQRVGDLLGFLETRHPTLAGRLAQVRAAQNQTFAPLNAQVSDQDVIALIPPMAGG